MPEDTEYIAPNFVARLQNQKNIDKEVKDNKWLWEVRSGDYRYDGFGNPNYFFRGTKDKKPFVPDSLELSAAEESYRDILEQLINSSSSDKPVVALDIGGMAGITWCRLANHFRKEVEAGKVVFVVTNAESNFEDQFVSNVDKDTLHEGDLELFRKIRSEGLVKYATADVMSLRKTTIEIQGKSIRLLANVDLLNERTAVAAHSRIPEIHIPRMLETLSDKGVYVCWDNTISLQFGHDYEEDRNIAFVDAINYSMDHFNLERVTEIERGIQKGEEVKPIILRKSGGPKIKAD